MRLVSFDPLRTLGIPGVHAVKPENWFREKAAVQAADWLLFPEYWQVNALYYVLKKRIFPSIGTYHLGHDKVEMHRAFEAAFPGNTPVTRILPRTPVSVEQILDEFSFPFVAKEIRSAMGMGVFLVNDRAEFLRYAARNEVLFAQEYLPIFRDLRIVIVGKTAAAGYWREAQEGCFHNNVAKGGKISFRRVPPEAVRLAENVAAELTIDHAGFDVAEVDGRYFLLEFNPRFGTRALNAAGIRIAELIFGYLCEVSQSPIQPETPKLPKAS
ncbi:MAG: hypothetical protein PVG78_02855 [Desulfobacterales bacterium]|jgi:ribosomal protein S6--L-glutamate ligase